MTAITPIQAAEQSGADWLTVQLARLDALKGPRVKRQPFTLTTEQFLGLRQMRAADRNVILGTFARMHEYEQRRRTFWNGAPFPLPPSNESGLIADWPAIRDEREAEAQRVFAAMNRGDA